MTWPRAASAAAAAATLPAGGPTLGSGAGGRCAARVVGRKNLTLTYDMYKHVYIQYTHNILITNNIQIHNGANKHNAHATTLQNQQ